MTSGPLVSDFGIAKIIENTLQQSTHGFIGTYTYAAPEQIQGKPQIASDQYSLGVITYEWLSGSPPFQGATMVVAVNHLHDSPQPLSSKITIAPSVEKVVLKALLKRPDDRYENIQSFASTLEQAYRSTLRSQSPLRIIQPMQQVMPVQTADSRLDDLLLDSDVKNAQQIQLIGLAQPALKNTRLVRQIPPILPTPPTP
ncbi:MAG: protein kinase, partial [Ktedonobacteraceae bacterium]